MIEEAKEALSDFCLWNTKETMHHQYGGGKNNLLERLFLFCLQMILIMLDFQRVPVSGGGGEGQMHGTWRVLREMDCCSHSNRGNPPFCFPALPTSPPVAITGQPYQNTRPGGKEGIETPVPNTWPCILFIFSCLPVVSAESSVWGFFAVFELVASAFLRAASGLQVALPTLTSLFLKSQRDLSVHLNFTATPSKVFDQKQKWILCTYM